MGYRILHCGENTENYRICIQERTAGFTTRAAEEGDIVYFAVKHNKQSLCSARGILDELTDYKPWEDAENYVQVWKVKDIEYCMPFDLKCLKDVGGKYWALKFIQMSKTISDPSAIDLLNQSFEENKTNTFTSFEKSESDEDTTYTIEMENEDSNDENSYEEVPNEEKLNIMGTFQNIRFVNETDPIRGLEPLVTEHFFSLFQHFSQERTILIPENRLFRTSGKRNQHDEHINGIAGIPDALLISYDKDSKKCPLRINMIEYECYGEGKPRTTDKFRYLNGTIIPQLMRFASTFSIVTDNSLRMRTIDDWAEKIINYVNDDDELVRKTNEWMKELHPDLTERRLERYLEKELKNALTENIRIILIIDELTTEEKNTITNIINSFKLDNSTSRQKDNCVDFDAYIVRLQEKINITDTYARFALSYQERV